MRTAAAVLAAVLLTAFLVVTSRAGASVPPTAVIYIAGDSITAEAYLPSNATFTAKLSTRLCGNACNTAGNPTVVNVAQGGQRCWTGTNNLEAQWPSIVDATPAPTTIIVSIGMNDVGVAGVTNQNIVDCWNWLYFNTASGSVARGIRVIPCLLVPVSSTRADLETQRLWLNGWLPAYFGASAVADFVTPLKSPTSEWIQPAFSWDNNVHPNWLGATGLAEYFPINLIQ